MMETKETIQEENKMGHMPVNRLLITISTPIIISMLLQAVYNIVDSIFVAKINDYAFTAVSMAFTIQNLMIALGAGTGVGVSALLSKSLGEKNFKRADKVASISLLLGVINAFVFFVFGLFFTGWFFRIQTNIPQIIKYGEQYLSIVCMCSIGIFMQFAFERMLMSTGKTVHSMLTQISGVIINIILDPILIFGLFGMPKMGVTGAALATVIGQIVAMGFGLYINLKVNKEIHLHITQIIPERFLLKEIYKVAIPSILMGSIGSVMTFCMNQILLGFTYVATAVFGAYFKIQSMIFMPVFGLNNGMVPIIAYNYGAKKKDRIMKCMHLSTAYAMGFMFIGFLIFQIIPGKLLTMFSATKEMLDIGIPALRILSTSYLLAGFCIIAGSVCQALGKATYSLVISVCRQLVVLVPAAFLLSLSGNLNLIWFSFPIAELVAFVMSYFFRRKVLMELKI
ncbi:MAG: MATE family efflux transporter [Lachnospiraceae bacterium]